MNDTASPTTPLWVEGADVPAVPRLARDLKAQVCVIGAGIAGLTTAYLLVRAGYDVVVLDRQGPGAGETGRTTAHLTCVLDERYAAIEKLHGQRAAQLAAASHAAALDLIEEIVQREAIECGFVRLDGYLMGDDLEQELAAALRAGVPAEMAARAPLPAFDTGPALRFRRQGQLHPLRYVAGLVRAILNAGGALYAHAQVQHVEGGTPAAVTTESGHTVRCATVVMATNTPGNDRLVIHTKQAPYRSYVIAGRVPKGSLTQALYWDSEDPYHYARIHAEPGASDECLIVGGEDHKTGQADDAAERFRRLESWTRERFPCLEAVRWRWSGQLQEPADGLGFIGKSPGTDSSVYVVTGTSGNGMTYGTLAGMLLRDLVAGSSNPWAELYDPARLTLGAAKQLLKENLNVAAQYARQAVAPDVPAPEEIPNGGGAVERHGLSRLAVYRDLNGRLHKLSAVCPHLGCIVKWNPVESSWDCPCHGSRFTPDGRVLNGPALTSLGPAREDA
jgi:glycine/D-amino acid oxidase-like deaminating enzyme/nitrite reductase/ring-hydroxylating ferredoxin subunit